MGKEKHMILALLHILFYHPAFFSVRYYCADILNKIVLKNNSAIFVNHIRNIRKLELSKGKILFSDTYFRLTVHNKQCIFFLIRSIRITRYNVKNMSRYI